MCALSGRAVGRGREIGVKETIKSTICHAARSVSCNRCARKREREMRSHALCIQNWYEWICLYTLLCFYLFHSFRFFFRSSATSYSFAIRIFFLALFGLLLSLLFASYPSSSRRIVFCVSLTKLQQVANDSDWLRCETEYSRTQKIRNGSEVKWVIFFLSTL